MSGVIQRTGGGQCACSVSTLDLARPWCATGPATAATHGANRFLKSVSGSGSSVTGEGKGDSLTAALGQDWDTGSCPGDVGHGTQDQGAQV